MQDGFLYQRLDPPPHPVLTNTTPRRQANEQNKAALRGLKGLAIVTTSQIVFHSENQDDIAKTEMQTWILCGSDLGPGLSHCSLKRLPFPEVVLSPLAV
uniref:Uncharacterized protein n=1 Tax=Echeneis naucrates TaxID=173247 RepID=A0A665WBW8_ECHNA